LYIEQNDEAGSQADGEPEDIKDGEAFVPPKVAGGDLEIISEHNVYLFCSGPTGGRE
jgi:hypothetical protein